MHPNIPARRIIDRFVEYHKRPFTVKDVANDTGLHPKTVRNLLPQLVQAGRIRVLMREQSGNIYGKPVAIGKQRSGKQYDWLPRKSKLKEVYDLVGKHTHIDEILRHANMCQETIYRYIRVLVMDGCIEKWGNLYKPLEFKPTLRPYSYYKGKRVESSSDDRGCMLADIKYLSRLNQVEVPQELSNMSNGELWQIQSRLYGMKEERERDQR